MQQPPLVAGAGTWPSVSDGIPLPLAPPLIQLPQALNAPPWLYRAFYMDLNMDTYCENYQEALNFSGFLPMGLMCPCHEKLPTTINSQPFKSLWLIGAWPQCGSWSRRARVPMPPLTSCNWEARAMQCWMGRHLHSMAICLSVGTSSASESSTWQVFL